MIATTSAVLLEEGSPVILRQSEAPESEIHAAAEMHSAGLSLFIADPSV